MKKSIAPLLMSLIICLTPQTCPAENVTYYIIAHQDDWQLFMTPRAYHDMINQNTKVIFIYTTAGDAGKGTTWWQARRAGALSSIQFAKRKRIEYVSPENIKINNHPIPRYTIENTRSYFINIPDGRKKGNGFPSHHHQSLKKLKKGQITSVKALTAQSEYDTQYKNWADFINTLQAIIEKESQPKMHLARNRINFIDPKIAAHSDHKYTGYAVEEALKRSQYSYQPAKFEGYVMKQKRANVNGTDLIWKIGIYFVYNQTAFEQGGYDHLKDHYFPWLFRQYQTH